MKIFIQTFSLLSLLSFLAVFQAYGDPDVTGISFPSLWEVIEKNAPSEKVSSFQLQASRIEKERDLRLGYPLLYLDARAFSTNDPALSFFSVLNQRQIHPSDFNPDSLNDSGYQFYQKGTLGLDWTFYDGGVRRTKIDSQEKIIQARKFDQKKGNVDLYTESAVLFGSLQILENESEALKKILNSTEKLMEQYRIGVKSNPLGYSGLLGLKSLKGRIQETLIDNEAAFDSARTGLSEKTGGLLPIDWKPLPFERGTTILPFARQFLPAKEGTAFSGFSPSIRAIEAEAESSEKLIEGEKAKEKPRLGLFSEASLYNGNRDNASSYVVGVYLRWDLFSMERYRKEDQARASMLALKAKSDDLRLKEKVDQENSRHSMSALEKEMDLISDRSGFLEEQFQISRKLFQNGSITILQVVEIMNQEVDLISRRTKVEMSYLNLDATRFRTAGMDIPLPGKEDLHE